MADADWDQVTRIGSKARTGGGAVQDREKVIKGSAALNAAKRQGAQISAEKKFGGTNSAGTGEGQALTKADRLDDAADLAKMSKTVGPVVGKAIADRRLQMEPKLTQAQLAQKCNVTPQVVQSYERGEAKPDQKILGNLERVLGIKLRGSDIGALKTFGPKK